MVGNKKSDLKVVISDAIDKLARRSNCEYDGLLGSISDDWFPSPLKKEFEGVRNHLLNCYEEEDVREYLRDRKELYTITDIQSVKYTPLEIDDKLDALIYIQSIFDLYGLW